MTEFTKYHKIEAAAKHTLPTGAGLVLQHKLDGQQAGIERAGDKLIVHSRNLPLVTLSMGEDGKVNAAELRGNMDGFGGFVAMVKSAFVLLMDWMEMNGIVHIYGEWLVPLKVKYPESMYRQFYVYDLVDTYGVYHDPYGNFPVNDFGFRHIDKRWELSGEVTHASLRELTEKMQAEFGYAIEGAVLKKYAASAEEQSDRRGNRLIYKDVLPAYSEDAKKVSAPHRLPSDQAIAAALPTRTIEKRYLDVVSANGGQFEGKLIPQIIGRVWNDFMQEILPAALADLKYPTINTKEVKRLVDQRAREFALSYVEAAA